MGESEAEAHVGESRESASSGEPNASPQPRPRWRGPLLVALAVLASVLAQVHAVRALWLRAELSGGAEGGVFMPDADGAASFAVGGGSRFFPSLVPATDGSVLVPPGHLLTLRGRGEVTLSTEVDARAPYVVVGEPGEVADRDQRRHLLDPTMLRLGASGGLELVPWDPEDVWTTDAARLGELRSRCGGVVQAHLHEHEVVLTMAGCGSVTATLAEPTVVVVAGPSWSRAESTDVFERRLVVRSAVLFGVALVLAIQALLAWSLGARTGQLLLGGLVLGVSLIDPALSVLAAALLTVALGLTWIVRWLLQLRRRLAIGLVLGAIVVVVGLVLALREETSVERIDERCLVVGYSTVAGSGFADDRPSLVDHLRESPGVCQGSAVARPFPGHSAVRIRDYLCHEVELRERATVVFYGASNDDFGWRGQTRSLWSSIRAASLLLLGELDPARWRAFGDTAVQGASDSREEQAEVFEELTRCVTRQGARMRFVHHFWAEDLDGGPSETRRTLRALRREATAAGGGESLDAYDELAPHAVWFFNDVVHPSEVGHAIIAARVRAWLGDPSTR